MKHWRFASFLAFVVSGCGEDPVAPDPSRVEDCANQEDDDRDRLADCLDPDCGCDADGDGVWGPEHGGLDCDDANPSLSPNNPEICNGVDDDCDAFVDDADPTWDPTSGVSGYVDADGDGFGGAPEAACEADPAWVATAGDCDDRTAAVSPDAPEICWGGVDDDCDGLVDSADPSMTPCHPALSGLVVLEAVVEGDPAVDALGTWISAGDTDADGWPELAVADAVGTYVVGAVPVPGVDVPGAAIAAAGTPGAVLAGPDWSGDGVGDLAWVAEGVAHLIAGPLPAAFSAADAFETVGADLDGSIAAGDLDGDGEADLAVGGGGSIHLGSGAVIPGWDTDMRLVAADLDGDGRAELVAGAAGEVRILPGDAASADDALVVLAGPAELGRSLAAGDADGDGYGDLALGADDEAWLIRGLNPVPMLVLTGFPDALPLGDGVILADLDGDGAAELVTAGWNPAGAAALWMVEGRTAGTGTVVQIAAATVNADIGEELGPLTAGDLDRDGFTDVAAGAPRSAADPSGRVLVLYGSPL